MSAGEEGLLMHGTFAWFAYICGLGVVSYFPKRVFFSSKRDTRPSSSDIVIGLAIPHASLKNDVQNLGAYEGTPHRNIGDVARESANSYLISNQKGSIAEDLDYQFHHPLTS